MKVVNGMYFSENTNNKVCNILSTSKERLRFYYGDIKTGKCWMDEHDTIGYVGKSCGSVKVPLLIKNSTSTGGGAILDHCILRIDSTTRKTTLYKQDNFHMPMVTVEGSKVLFDNEVYANCDNPEQAQRLGDFMSGKRNSK